MATSKQKQMKVMVSLVSIWTLKRENLDHRSSSSLAMVFILQRTIMLEAENVSVRICANTFDLGLSWLFSLLAIYHLYDAYCFQINITVDSGVTSMRTLKFKDVQTSLE
jgi:hypothetical protein